MGVMFPFADKYSNIKDHIDEIVVLASLLDINCVAYESRSSSIGDWQWEMMITYGDKCCYITFYYDTLDSIIDTCVQIKTIGYVGSKYIAYGGVDTEEELEVLYIGLQKVKEML